MANDGASVDAPRGTLGTFAGVFTPSILTILGLILFLRTGFLVGAAGLPQALLIILLANLVSALTSVSLAAIATNMRVKGGGDYYLISRTLGPEHGGSIGIVLFLAQSVSIAFYAIGFGEVVGSLIQVPPPWAAQAIAAALVTALLVLAWLGADVATRFQFIIMGILAAALVAFFVGGVRGWDSSWPGASGSTAAAIPFWSLFAIFFPAVTGFTQGVSMSGDLENPSRSLPLGTFLAVGVSALVYVGAALVFAANVPADTLVRDYASMRGISIVPWLFDAGVIAATISSALASLLGAPRILQSLARDRIFPFLDAFAHGVGPAMNPRRGVLLSGVIAYATVAVGNLNLVAPVVSMFFLISYGLLNYATYFEASGRSPSFRPRFRLFHPRLSLVGALGCGGAMIAINPLAGGVSIAILFALQQYIARTVVVARWADAARSSRLQQIRDSLHLVRAEVEHPRDWRPVLLAFSDNPERRERLIRFASWVEGGSGFTTSVRIVPGDDLRARIHRAETEAEVRADIAKRGLEAFTCVIAAADFDAAIPTILQAHGLGPIRPNTVLMNWFDENATSTEPGLESYGRYIRVALRFGCHAVMLAAEREPLAALGRAEAKDRRIDVWFLGDATGRLMLLLAYLMTRTEEWKGARIRLLAPVISEHARVPARADLEAILEDVRISADVDLVDVDGPEAVLARSRDAGVVFFPFELHEGRPRAALGCSMDALVDGWKLTAFVLGARDIDLSAEPEEGILGAIATAKDAAEKAEDVAARAEADLAEATAATARARDAVAALVGADSNDPARLTQEEALREAEGDEAHTRRRAARARAKATSAAEGAARIEEVKGASPERLSSSGRPALPG